MAKPFNYTAFISYRHKPLDIQAAKRLQFRLEHFRIPRSSLTQWKRKRFGRIFRDQEELPITSNINEDIENALMASDFLFVVCSRSTRDSEWVSREIRLFVTQHDASRILAVILEGTPEEVMPDLLRGLPDSQIIDYRENDCLCRICAAVLHQDPNSFYERCQIEKWVRILMASVLFLAVAVGTWRYTDRKLTQIRQARQQALENETRFFSEESIRQVAQGNISEAALLATAIASDEQGNNPLPGTVAAMVKTTGNYNADVSAVQLVSTQELSESIYSMNTDWNRQYLLICTASGLEVRSMETQELLRRFLIRTLYSDIFPTESNEVILAGSDSVYCLDLETGFPKWSVNLLDSNLGKIKLEVFTEMQYLSASRSLFAIPADRLLRIDATDGQLSDCHVDQLPLEVLIPKGNELTVSHSWKWCGFLTTPDGLHKNRICSGTSRGGETLWIYGEMENTETGQHCNAVFLYDTVKHSLQAIPADFSDVYDGQLLTYFWDPQHFFLSDKEYLYCMDITEKQLVWTHSFGAEGLASMAPVAYSDAFGNTVEALFLVERQSSPDTNEVKLELYLVDIHDGSLRNRLTRQETKYFPDCCSYLEQLPNSSTVLFRYGNNSDYCIEGYAWDVSRIGAALVPMHYQNAYHSSRVLTANKLYSAAYTSCTSYQAELIQPDEVPNILDETLDHLYFYKDAVLSINPTLKECRILSNPDSATVHLSHAFRTKQLFLLDGEYLAGSERGTVSMINLHDGTAETPQLMHDFPLGISSCNEFGIFSLTDPQEANLYVCFQDWEGKTVQPISLGENQSVTTWAPFGNIWPIVLKGSREIALVDVHQNTVQILEGAPFADTDIKELDLVTVSGGHSIAVLSQSAIAMYDVDSGKLLWIDKLSEAKHRGFSPDGTQWITVSKEGKIEYREAQSGELLSVASTEGAAWVYIPYTARLEEQLTGLPVLVNTQADSIAYLSDSHRFIPADSFETGWYDVWRNQLYVEGSTGTTQKCTILWDYLTYEELLEQTRQIAKAHPVLDSTLDYYGLKKE